MLQSFCSGLQVSDGGEVQVLMDKATTQQDSLQDDLDELWGNRIIAPKSKRRKVEDATEEDSFMAMGGGAFKDRHDYLTPMVKHGLDFCTEMDGA